MKKIIISLVFLLPIFSQGQSHAIGLFGGGVNYVGEIGNETYLYPKNLGVGIIYKVNINSRLSARLTFGDLKIDAHDKNALNKTRKDRNIGFENKITEFGLGIEYSFLNYGEKYSDNPFTPYIFLGVANIKHKIYKAEQYTLSTPFGLGFKAMVFKNLELGIETRAAYTFTDNLENINQLLLKATTNADDWYMFTGFSLVYVFGERNRLTCEGQ